MTSDIFVSFLTVFFCCIAYSAECGNKYCDSWMEYIFDVDECRSQGRVYWVYAQLSSLVPFTGLSSFHIGKRLDGAVKVFHGIVIVTPGTATGNILDQKHIHDNGFSVCMASFVLVVDMVKVVWDYFTEKETLSQFIIMVIAVVISGRR